MGLLSHLTVILLFLRSVTRRLGWQAMVMLSIAIMMLLSRALCTCEFLYGIMSIPV